MPSPSEYRAPLPWRMRRAAARLATTVTRRGARLLGWEHLGRLIPLLALVNSVAFPLLLNRERRNAAVIVSVLLPPAIRDTFGIELMYTNAGNRTETIREPRFEFGWFRVALPASATLAVGRTILVKPGEIALDTLRFSEHELREAYRFLRSDASHPRSDLTGCLSLRVIDPPVGSHPKTECGLITGRASRPPADTSLEGLAFYLDTRAIRLTP